MHGIWQPAAFMHAGTERARREDEQDDRCGDEGTKTQAATDVA
jgi:hypothetical protein